MKGVSGSLLSTVDAVKGVVIGHLDKDLFLRSREEENWLRKGRLSSYDRLYPGDGDLTVM